MEAIDRLLAIEEIRNLKHKYFRAIDMADYELLSTIFTDDITVDYRGGTYRWQASGRDEIITSMKYSFHDQTCAMHTGHHPEIEIIDSNNVKISSIIVSSSLKKSINFEKNTNNPHISINLSFC